MDQVIILTVAFALGLAAKQTGLPPLVGYLIAGFILNFFDLKAASTLEELADVGVLLLLFTIGLKLKLRSLSRPEVWAGTTIHMLITVVVFGAAIFALSVVGFSMFGALDFEQTFMLSFALSFSSTVFAVKILEEKAEMASLHSRVAIGVLIMQDIYAVLFLTFSTGKIPSIWSLAIPIVLFIIRPVLMAMMERSGHGEVLTLCGFFLALGIGATGFELVGMKPDLGALILGMLVAGHPKATEMAKSLFGFKDLFLVFFFLTIGLSGSPSMTTLGVAFLLVLAVPFKMALFFLLFTRFKLRARTGLLGTLSLANYSEFGLIVGAVAVAKGWLANEWLITIAIALSLTFILAAPLNTAANNIYRVLHRRLIKFETEERHPDDQPIDPGDATIAIFGMGRIGSAAYDDMRQRYGEVVVGIDNHAETVKKHTEVGRKVILGDPTDFDFWERTPLDNKGKIKLVLLTMTKYAANLEAAKQISLLATEKGWDVKLASTAKYEDEVQALRAAGVHSAYNLYAEAGFGFAEHVLGFLKPSGGGGSKEHTADQGAG